MSNVTETVKIFEEHTSSLRSQRKQQLPAFSIYGEDSIDIDIPYIIESVKEFTAICDPDCLPHFSNIISELEKIEAITATKNNLVNKHNSLIDSQILDLEAEIEQEISDAPELSFNRVVRISKTKIEEKYVQVLDKVYSNLGFTNIERKKWRDKIYYNDKVNPKIRDSIISEFNKVCFESNIEPMPNIGDFIQLEKHSAHWSDTLKAIKARI